MKEIHTCYNLNVTQISHELEIYFIRRFSESYCVIARDITILHSLTCFELVVR